MSEIKYHVYHKNNCIYHSLSEEEFHQIWTTLNNLISVIGGVEKHDISYEKVVFNKDLSSNSSH